MFFAFASVFSWKVPRITDSFPKNMSHRKLHWVIPKCVKLLRWSQRVAYKNNTSTHVYIHIKKSICILHTHIYIHKYILYR